MFSCSLSLGLSKAHPGNASQGQAHCASLWGPPSLHLPDGCLTLHQRNKTNSPIAEASAIKTNLGFYKAASLLELPYHLVKQTTLVRFGVISPHQHPPPRPRVSEWTVCNLRKLTPKQQVLITSLTNHFLVWFLSARPLSGLSFPLLTRTVCGILFGDAFEQNHEWQKVFLRYIYPASTLSATFSENG